MIRGKNNIESKQQHTASPLTRTSTSIGHHMHQINGKWAHLEH